MTMAKEPVRYRITKVKRNIATIFAIGCDVAQLLIGLIPFIGWLLAPLIAIIVILSFQFWFALNGVFVFTGRKSSKKVLWTLLSSFAEFLPVVDLLAPGFIMMVWKQSQLSREEDREKALSVASGSQNVDEEETSNTPSEK